MEVEMNGTEPIRVLVADKDNFMRNMMVRMLNSEPDIKVVGVAYNGSAAVQLFPVVSPDVTLIDLNLPEMDGRQTMTEISKNYPGARFVVTGGHDFNPNPPEAFANEVCAYWLREFTREELIGAVRKLTES
jgi:DNA-binding NarL/FixJ family response regulator